MAKKKIINDPLYGFLYIESKQVYTVIQHPYFQRLRHIKQLGLTDLVYPGALHTRFQHALGAMHLITQALNNLRSKGVIITDDEQEGAQLAILLHDIGHGPFSHALEESLLPDIKHESLSYLFMNRLNDELGGVLEVALKIFRNGYPRKFFHQLVSSQLDMDRLDYLNRDSFFAGVPEGSVGVDRIIAMLAVDNDELVVEEKGIYSVENFLTARRLMYWQVYLHKTSVAAERMLVNLIRRAKYLVQSGKNIPASKSFLLFLNRSYTIEDFTKNFDLLHHFGNLDDNDIWGAIKLWQNHDDKILSTLSSMLIQRKLFQIQMSNSAIHKKDIEKIVDVIAQQYQLLRSEVPYLLSSGFVSNEGYTEGQKINIIMKNGNLQDIAKASDLPSIQALTQVVKKNYLCWPKDVSL